MNELGDISRKVLCFGRTSHCFLLEENEIIGEIDVFESHTNESSYVKLKLNAHRSLGGNKGFIERQFADVMLCEQFLQQCEFKRVKSGWSNGNATNMSFVCIQAPPETEETTNDGQS